MSSANAIGVFDSGLGGLSAVREFLHILPNENIIYFGDTAEFPTETEAEKSLQNMLFRIQIFCLRIM